MSHFIDHVKNAEFIQFLRSKVKPEDLEEFDKMVESKIKEYDAMWSKVEPMIEKYRSGVENVKHRAENEPGFDKKPTDG